MISYNDYKLIFSRIASIMDYGFIKYNVCSRFLVGLFMGLLMSHRNKDRQPFINYLQNK